MDDAPTAAADPARVAAGLAAGRRLGMFFGLAAAPAPTGQDRDRDGGGWRPPSALAEPEVLDVVLADVAAAVGAGHDEALAASLLVQGLASRLLSPQVACLAVEGCLPDLAGALVWRRPGPGIPELGLRPGAGRAGPGGPLLERLWRQSRHELVDPVVAALRRRVRLPRSIVTGNLASSLVSALTLLPPGTRGRNPDLLSVALRLPEVTGALRTAPDGGLERRTCCLNYRAARPVLCGTCPLQRRTRRDRSFGNRSADAGDQLQ